MFRSSYNFFFLFLNIRLKEQYLQLDILNSSLDFLLALKYLDKGMQTCLIFWNSYSVSRFVWTGTLFILGMYNGRLLGVLSLINLFLFLAVSSAFLCTFGLMYVCIYIPQ